MSSQSPQGPRPRRRIAGERRPASSSATATPPAPPETPVADAAPEPTPEPAPPTPPTPDDGPDPTPDDAPRGPSVLALGILGGLAALLVAVALFLGLVHWNYGHVKQQDTVDEAARTAPAVAERASSAILSYGYQSLDADEHAAEKYMTPAYAKKYADTYDRLVKPNAAKLRAKVEAEVKASGVAHADADRVNVLLYVNQTTTSTANGGQPQVALNRVQFSMVRHGDTWLVDNITSY
jgi:Mce-associated membrane protein